MSSTFDNLSQDLTPDEKKTFLVKIQSSLNLSARDTDSIISKAESPDDLKHRLTKEFQGLGLLDKLILQVAGFFRNRSAAELMAEKKLSGAKTSLRDRVPDFVHFSREEWSPQFAKALYDLYYEAQGLKPLFDHLFLQKLTLEAGLLQIFFDEYPVALHTLEDLFTSEEIAEAYLADQKRSSIQAQLDHRLEEYLAKVPPVVFDKVRDRLKVLYFLRPLVQYPYAFLLELFGHNPDKGEAVKYPFFTGAPWRKTAGLLERLYYGLHLCTKVLPPGGGLDHLLRGTIERLGDEKAGYTVEALNRRLGEFIRLGQETAQTIPWKEVLQWSFQDPYYGVKYVLPQFSVKDFYQSTLQMNLREELDTLMPQVRQDLLVRERALLFQNGVFQPLDFYVPGVGSSLGTQKIRGFAFPETLGLLWGFLNHHFAKKIIPFHQSLARMVAPASKASLQSLTNVVDDLTVLKQKIFQFDRGLHPDAEEGKEFHKLKFELNTKTLSLKPFLQLIQDKDAQALEFVNRGLEGIQILLNQLAGVRDRNVPALKAVLKLPYLLEGQQETIENGLDRLLVILQKTLFVLREAQSLEN